MKENVIILRYGELYLKGNNRSFFENTLLKNIRHSLKDFTFELKKISGRYIISNYNEEDYNLIIEKLTKVFGLVSVSPAYEFPTNIEDIENKCKELAADLSGTFRITTKRADKKFPIKSDNFSAMMGEVILKANPNLKVDLHNPDTSIIIEIRENGQTYILSKIIHAHGGMPVGTAGKGLLMLSGGIDSPVAGYMMAKRGLTLYAIHFHSFPYTSLQAKEKVLKLKEILEGYTGKIKLFVVPFTKIQEAIHVNCFEEYMITIMRRIMLRIAERVAKKYSCGTIITGESLGQVASQTLESITVTNSVIKELPVFRPLIGMDKTEIMKISNDIGTYETSILPYEDCCTVLLPKNPVIKPTIKKAIHEEEKFNLDYLIDDAINNIEIIE